MYAVCVSRRGYKIDTKPAQVEKGRIEDIGIRFTGITSGSRNLTQLKRPAEELAEMFF
jgi:hypothetical protein